MLPSHTVNRETESLSHVILLEEKKCVPYIITLARHTLSLFIGTNFEALDSNNIVVYKVTLIPLHFTF